MTTEDGSFINGRCVWPRLESAMKRKCATGLKDEPTSAYSHAVRLQFCRFVGSLGHCVSSAALSLLSLSTWPPRVLRVSIQLMFTTAMMNPKHCSLMLASQHFVMGCHLIVLSHVSHERHAVTLQGSETVDEAVLTTHRHSCQGYFHEASWPG